MYIAVLGYGTVGSGVVEVFRLNQEIINRKAEETVEIKYVLDLRDFPGDPVEPVLVHDFNTILEDDSVRVVVEVMGGIEPAFTFVRQCLEKGKSVVTSNKELVARHGTELILLAKENNVNFLFEASVGGGIPIIRSMNQSITADDITEITGILNGTTNYILTKMSQEGRGFDEVLKVAQEKGYAERNPEADVEGHDACRKIAILSSMAYGIYFDYNQIYTEGITGITQEDFAYAQSLDAEIKLLALSKKIDGRVFARVAPALVPNENTMAAVHGVFNAVLVKGNAVDELMFTGRGAGKMPTASAVVADVVDAVKHAGTNIILSWGENAKLFYEWEEIPVEAFVRFQCGDAAKSKEAVKKQFPKAVDVSLPAFSGEVAFITGMETEGSLQKKLDQLVREGAVEGVVSVIRTEGQVVTP